MTSASSRPPRQPNRPFGDPADELRIKDAALAIAPNGVAVIDLEGRLAFVNPALLRLCGRSREELTGSLVADLIDDFSAPTREAAGPDGVVVREHGLRRKDGVAIPVQITAALVSNHDREPVGVVASFVDLSAARRSEEAQGTSDTATAEWVEAITLAGQRRYEEELRAKEAALAASIDAIAIAADLSGRKRAEEELRIKEAAIALAPNGIAVVDLEGRFSYVNEAFAKLFGYGRDELVGRSAIDLIGQNAAMAMQVVLREGRWEGEETLLRRDGVAIPVHVTATAVPDQLGNPVALMASVVDLSPTKHAERELRLKDAAMAIAASGIAMADLEGKFTYVNDAFVKLTGFERAELVGRPVTSWFGERTAPIMEAVQRDGHLISEESLQRKDGMIIPVHVTASVVPDENGRPVALMGSFVDLSPVKRAEEELRLKDAAMEASLSAVVIGGMDGRIRYVNDAYVRLSGYERQELEGQLSMALFPEGQPIVDSVVREGFFVGQVDHRCKDGSIAHVQLLVSLVRDQSGAPVASISTMADITALKRTEQKLRLRDAAMAASLSAIIIGSLDGRIQYVNDAYVRLFGYEREEVIGRQVVDLFPEGRAAVEALERDGSFVGELAHRCKDGRIAHVQISVNVVRDANEVPVASVATMADITALRQAEQALARRTADLERSNRELEQFAYIASHDLQEPLRMVSSYTQLLAKRYHGRLDSEADDFIDYAVGGANRMQRLISDLLSYSRVGTQGKAPTLVDVRVVLEQALSNLAAAIEENQATVTHGRLPVVNADETQLVQVFQNLIGNALKFRSSTVPHVQVHVERTQTDWLFSVQDNGVGIAREFHHRLFQIFQRLHGKQVPGTGIGLALCKRIVERHGGTIWIVSEAGQGATFRFTLPA
jgi:PAS domain S-box-containing protein